jgi:hypothetical protein
MANTSDVLPFPTNSFPDDLVAAVAREAEADADRVVEFLRYVGFELTAEKPIGLSRDQLLFIGALLRLRSWEDAGVPIHFSIGLPQASKILADAIRSAQQGRGAYPKELSHVVHNLFIDRVAWHSRRDLGGVVELGGLDNETALDVVAELLWSRRRAEGEGKR